MCSTTFYSACLESHGKGGHVHKAPGESRRYKTPRSSCCYQNFLLPHYLESFFTTKVLRNQKHIHYTRFIETGSQKPKIKMSPCACTSCQSCSGSCSSCGCSECGVRRPLSIYRCFRRFVYCRRCSALTVGSFSSRLSPGAFSRHHCSPDAHFLTSCLQIRDVFIQPRCIQTNHLSPCYLFLFSRPTSRVSLFERMKLTSTSITALNTQFNPQLDLPPKPHNANLRGLGRMYIRLEFVESKTSLGRLVVSHRNRTMGWDKD